MIAPEPAETERAPGARRCLILANPRAGALSWRAKLEALPQRLLQRLSRLRPGRRPPPLTPSETVLPSALTDLAQLAAEAGLEANVELIPPPAQLPALIRRAQDEGFDTIVAVGGDGTVRSVAQALVHSPLRLGILPMGTANNVARSLGIPFETPQAMRVLAEGVERRIDVGWIGDIYFLEAAGVGLFADAFQAFGREEARPWQVLRLLKIVGPLFWNLRSRTLTLTLDDAAEQDEALLILAANGLYFGEGMVLAPEAVLDDGLFDVVIVGALSRLELLEFALAVMRGTHLQLPKVRYARARSVEIRRIHRSHRPLPVHADDQIAACTPVRMDVLPGALRVIAPSLSASAVEPQ